MYPHNKWKFYKQEDVLWAILPSWARSIMRIFPIKKLKSSCLGHFEHGKENVGRIFFLVYLSFTNILYPFPSLRSKRERIWSILKLISFLFSRFCLKNPFFLYKLPLSQWSLDLVSTSWSRTCYNSRSGLGTKLSDKMAGNLACGLCAFSCWFIYSIKNLSRLTWLTEDRNGNGQGDLVRWVV